MKKVLKIKTKIFIVLSVAVILLISYAASELFQLSERAVISGINENLDTPYKMLEKKSDMSVGDCRVIGGFGVNGYYDSKYGENDPEGGFDAVENNAVVYYVTSWPDTVIGAGRVTRLVCADPEYSLYGCNVGGYCSGLEKALVEHGFEKTGGNLNGSRFEKRGVSISFEKDPESNRMTCFSISVGSSNVFHIMY